MPTRCDCCSFGAAAGDAIAEWLRARAVDATLGTVASVGAPCTCADTALQGTVQIVSVSGPWPSVGGAALRVNLALVHSYHAGGASCRDGGGAGTPAVAADLLGGLARGALAPGGLVVVFVRDAGAGAFAAAARLGVAHAARAPAVATAEGVAAAAARAGFRVLATERVDALTELGATAGDRGLEQVLGPATAGAAAAAAARSGAPTLPAALAAAHVYCGGGGGGGSSRRRGVISASSGAGSTTVTMTTTAVHTPLRAVILELAAAAAAGAPASAAAAPVAAPGPALAPRAATPHGGGDGGATALRRALLRPPRAVLHELPSLVRRNDDGSLSWPQPGAAAAAAALPAVVAWDPCFPHGPPRSGGAPAGEARGAGRGAGAGGGGARTCGGYAARGRFFNVGLCAWMEQRGAWTARPPGHARPPKPRLAGDYDALAAALGDPGVHPLPQRVALPDAVDLLLDYWGAPEGHLGESSTATGDSGGGEDEADEDRDEGDLEAGLK